MSDYRRLISYIYAYDKDVKGHSVGFAKLENRNGQCKVSVSVKKLYTGNTDLSVYLLAGEHEIYIGHFFTRGQGGEFRTAVQTENVEKSGYPLSAMHGLSLRAENGNGRYYMTIWEEPDVHAAELEVESTLQAELERQAEMERQAEEERQAEAERQAELKQQAEAERQAETERQALTAFVPRERLEQGQRYALDQGTPGMFAERKGTSSAPATTGANDNWQPDTDPNPWGSALGVETITAPNLGENAGQLKDDFFGSGQETVISESGPEELPGALQGETEPVTGQQSEGNQNLEADGEDNPEMVGEQSQEAIGNQSQETSEEQEQSQETAEGQDQETVRNQNSKADDNGEWNQEQNQDQNQGIEAQLESAPPVQAASMPRMDLGQRKPEEADWQVYAQAASRGSLPLWEKLRRRYAKIQAFDYAGGCEILTIKPQDIGLLPRENWVYGNNSFLLHGYYNYRYLILVRLNEPDGSCRYLLGVPGMYYTNEKYMASMFGFPDFVLAKKQPHKDGRFGYWYTDIKI